jgi:hypothetical protein
MTFSTLHIGHSRHGLFFTRLDCQSNVKPSEKNHDLPDSIPNHHKCLLGLRSNQFMHLEKLKKVERVENFAKKKIPNI